MKILVLSFFYYPDLGAGSFRTAALVEQLKALKSSNVTIDVLTTLPNRYASYPMDAPQLERQEGITIQRIALPKHRSGMLDQALAFLFFFKEVMRIVKHERYALVYATSSRLMPAVLGAWVARQQRASLYLDIRDLFVDTLGDVFPSWLAMITKPVFARLERWTFARAKHINLVSKGFEPYMQQHYPRAQVSWFTNGIDKHFLNHLHAYDYKPPEILTILYAGNIGEGQGLERIIPDLAQRLEGKAQFKIIGDGGKKTLLEEAICNASVKNVVFISPMSRDDLLKAYQQADVLFMHLNDYDAFRKVLPSKLFEYAAMGKPIWAGVAGYAAEFMRQEMSNIAVFKPCDAKHAMDVFGELVLDQQLRVDFIKKYQREHIMKTMAQGILSYTL